MEKSDFDRDVEERRRRNQRMLEELGLATSARQLQAAVAAEKAAVKAPARRKRGREAGDGARAPVEIRRSTRERPKVTYNEDAAFRELLPAAGPRGPKRGHGADFALTEDEVEALRALQLARTARNKDGDDEDGGPRGPRGPRDSGKGMRRQGGQVYDSETGVTCHCPRCLRNRHGEDADAAEASGAWVCPCCRGSCGAGCVTCCNCGPCRKRAGMAPTGQIKGDVLAGGYTNAHDYLVGLTTGENQAKLTERKLKQPWGAWMKQQPAGQRGQGARGKAKVQEGEAEDEEEDEDKAEDDDNDEAEEEDEEEQDKVGSRRGRGLAGGGAKAACTRQKRQDTEDEEEEEEEDGEEEEGPRVALADGQVNRQAESQEDGDDATDGDEDDDAGEGEEEAAAGRPAKAALNRRQRGREAAVAAAGRKGGGAGVRSRQQAAKSVR
ncbi:hypothetical protein GPECTOR_13g755 [Gonium pectorale]|uniref:Zinc-finger domain-containing protein n=1 Tax=Gonium pectorale TaxID=33097 RepID=A0A150GNB1_GONPE|nr:hypothetical protein GPECTOR_13g755 [Gonium pectorale]|eukprot:KXZ51268.1 hypothetical protein GPECTOR_13g755 [Gonium pectorale]